MAVDDPGRGRDEAAERGERRLDPAKRVGAEEFEILDAVRRRLGADALEQAELALLAGDDELAQPFVRHAALGAIGVEHLAAGDAGARLETTPRIIDAGMDDLAVARGGLEADAVFALQHHHLDAGARQRPRHREPDHPGADDDAFDRFRHGYILRETRRHLKLWLPLPSREREGPAKREGEGDLTAGTSPLTFPLLCNRAPPSPARGEEILLRRLEQALDRRRSVAPPFAQAVGIEENGPRGETG